MFNCHINKPNSPLAKGGSLLYDGEHLNEKETTELWQKNAPMIVPVAAPTVPQERIPPFPRTR
jgi:hypothetical protein